MGLQSKEILGTTSSSDRWTFKIIVTENSVDEESGTSNVTIENFLGRPSFQSSSYFAGNLTVNYSAGGQNYSEDKYLSSGTIPAGGWFSIGSHSFTIKHTTEPITINVGGSMSTSSFNPNSASASGTITLTEILGIFRLGVNGVWKKTTTYLGVNGIWKKCKVHIGSNGTWKKGE